MVSCSELVQYLDALLNPESGIDDPSNNGLQVQGTDAVRRAVFGVDACRALFEVAVDADAAFVFVHHGLSWGGGIRTATGVPGERLRLLLANGVSLYASHLPLDMHAEVGHNAVMARELQLGELRPFFKYHGTTIGWAGTLPQPSTPAAVAARLTDLLGGAAKTVGEADRQIHRLGIVSGGGADAVEDCAEAGIDCLVTGEFTHQHYHTALEANVPVVVGGHYATETPGIREVMARVQEQFGVDCAFVDLPTGL